jgi:hypothetical protein
MVFNYDDAVSDKIADGCELFQTLARRASGPEEANGAKI